MTQRLIPHRSERRQGIEATIATIVFGAVGFSVRWFFEEWIAFIAALIAMYATFWFSTWWAQKSGQEMITPAEASKRQLQERAETPILVQSFEDGAGLATSTGIATLLVVDFQYPELLLVLMMAAFFVGAISGLYSAIDARRYVGSARSSSPNSEEPTISTAEGWMRHYLGYVVGLSVGILVAQQIENRELAATAMFATFFIAKFAVDISYTSLEFPRFGLLEIRPIDFLLAIPIGMVRWGLPLGILVPDIRSD